MVFRNNVMETPRRNLIMLTDDASQQKSKTNDIFVLKLGTRGAKRAPLEVKMFDDI